MLNADPQPTDYEKIKDSLFNNTMAKEWGKVEEVYRDYPSTLTAKLTKSKDTGLHIAISSYCHEGKRHHELPNKNLKGHVRTVVKMFKIEDLKSKNVKGDTPLHLAAATGWDTICDDIASKDKKSELVGIRNQNGETPLFLAAYHGQLDAFLCLHYYYYEKNNMRPADYSDCRRAKDGNTILHSAISGEYFELAIQIIKKCQTLINMKNVDGETPLHLLARMTNVFKSCRHLNLYDSIIYKFAPVEEIKERYYTPAVSSNNDQSRKKDQTSERPHPENYKTCATLFVFLWTSFYKCLNAGFPGNKKRDGRPSDEENQHQGDKKNQKNEGEKGSNRDLYPRNYEDTVLLFKFGMKIILVVLGFGYNEIKSIHKEKKLHARAVEILNKLAEAETQYKYDHTGQQPTELFKLMFYGEFDLTFAPPTVEVDGNRDQNQTKKENKSEKEYKSTPILEAAKWGVLEVVDKILRKCPIAMGDLDADGKNLLMVAAQYRQVSVFDKLLENEMLQEYLFHQVDNDGNGILHLAARLEEGTEHWDIPGFALQMQGEIKWYKYVESKVPKMSFARPNKYGDSPKKIFSDTHGWLRKEAAEWLRKTSDSCSVIAALVASVGFATSASIPGGPDQTTGYPLFKDHPMFTVFAITSFIALSLSVTALALFLSVITSRCQERDFMKELPTRLLMGLTSLFASIALMLVSFCAGNSFILRDKVKVGAMPIYVLAAIPVMLFALAQLPLYSDLWHAMQGKVLRRSYELGSPSRAVPALNAQEQEAVWNKFRSLLCPGFKHGYHEGS